MSLALLIVIVFGLTHDSATWGLITGLAYLGAFDLFNGCSCFPTSERND